jgi:GNAT superfamily N-acetyltransferase
MTIQRAGISDIPAINRLLRQVLTVHHEGRPDLFKPDCKKYTDEELCQLLEDESRPVFGAWLDGTFVGYAFCILQEHKNDNVLTDIRTLYIDDLCVEETMRGQHVGTALYEYVLDYARSIGCYNVTLNVWTCNPSAMRFYERLGMQPQKIGMETVLM